MSLSRASDLMVTAYAAWREADDCRSEAAETFCEAADARQYARELLDRGHVADAWQSLRRAAWFRAMARDLLRESGRATRKGNRARWEAERLYAEEKLPLVACGLPDVRGAA